MRIRASKIKVIDDRLTYNGIDIGPADEFKREQMKHSSLAHRYTGDLDEWVGMNHLSAVYFVGEKIKQMSAHDRIRFYDV